jgi:hypothetical protein
MRFSSLLRYPDRSTIHVETMKTKLKLQTHVFRSGAAAEETRKNPSNLIDRSMRPVGTCSLVAGVGAAAAGMLPVSGYLLATGSLLHLISWFGDWWKE